MEYTATAAVLHGAGSPFVLETVQLDALRPDEVLVRVAASGICHTDLMARDLLPSPAVLGHEGCGVIEATGRAVSELRAGDWVVMSYAWCGTCTHCRQGQPYTCESNLPLNFSGRRQDGSATLRLGGQPVSAAFFQQSSFATRAITLARDVVKVPPGSPPELLAALPCGVMTGAGAVLNALQVRAGEGLAVFGAGAVGLSAIMAARIVGAHPIVAIDIHPQRLELARELGATLALNATDPDVAARLHALAPRGLPYAVETSGSERAFSDALDCLGLGGTCAYVTVPGRGANIPFNPEKFFLKAARMQGVFLGSAVPAVFLPRLLAWQQQGRFPFERLVRTYGLADINRAVADAAGGVTVKPVLMMPGADAQ